MSNVIKFPSPGSAQRYARMLRNVWSVETVAARLAEADKRCAKMQAANLELLWSSHPRKLHDRDLAAGGWA